MIKRLSAIALVAAASMWAQATTSLRGTVKDTSGAVIAEAVVSVADASTGSLRKVVSDKTGEYQFPQITPGAYSLTVEKAGFTTAVKKDITLSVNTPATVDVQLEIGAVGTTVSVEAEASTVNTVDASVGNAFIEKQISDLPLQTRNVVELLSIQPGVTQTGRSAWRAA